MARSQEPAEVERTEPGRASGEQPQASRRWTIASADEPGVRAILRAFDGLREGVCLLDRDGYYVALNAVAERIFQRPAAGDGGLIGRHYLDHDLTAEGSDFDRAFRVVTMGDPQRVPQTPPVATGHQTPPERGSQNPPMVTGSDAYRAVDVTRSVPRSRHAIEIADGGLWIVARWREVAAPADRAPIHATPSDATDRYQSLVEASSSIVWCADAEGRLVDGSPSWRAFTGQTLDQCHGVGWLDAIHPEDRPRTWQIWRAGAAARRPFQHEVRLRRADGAWATTTFTGVPVLAPDGTVREWVGTSTDVTAQRRVEQESARLLEAEREARAVAEEANRAKDAFLATVSHELRTPLSAMLGWARMLRSGTLRPDRAAHALGVIERNALVQAQIVEDLLDVSRIVAGKLRLDVVEADLPPVLDEAIDAVRPALEAKRIHFEQRIDPKAGPVLGDPARLRQIVWNLLANAVKFTPAEGRVELSLDRAGSEIVITVADSGPGIPPELKPRLFARFQQADMSTTRLHGGLGLGLAITRHLVELHGGAIAIADDTGPGHPGATFVVRLPIAPNHPRPSFAPRPRRTSTRPLQAPAELSGLRVLVIDDQPDIRDLVASILAACGADITAVESAREAREIIMHARPDVVFCDIAMPLEDGYAFIAWLRALPREVGGLLPCGALTAYASAEDRRRILDAGYNLHLPKPVEPEEIVQATLSLSRMARAIG